MKKFCKGSCLALALLLLLAALGSCVKKENNAPDGMMIASAAGADYLLYVPTTWNLNTFYGVSGAYRDASERSNVSVNRFPAGDFAAAEGEDRNAAYWEQVCLPVIRERLLDGRAEPFTADEEHADHPVVFGGKDAVYRHVSGLSDGVTLHFVQVVAERTVRENEADKSYFYVLSFVATEAAYSRWATDVDAIIREFTFSDTTYLPEDEAWKPAKVKAPSGMKIASSNEVAYRLFVPEDWVVDREQRIFAAYEPNDRTNVSVVAYLPPESGLSVDDFFAMENELMQSTAGAEGFALLSQSEDGTLGQRPAKIFDFQYRIGANTYRYRQLIAIYKGMFYTLTYTSTEEHFAEHLDALEAVAAAFIFR